MVIPKAVLQGTSDRVAAQMDILTAAIVNANVEGGGLYYPRIHGGIPTTGLYGTENDLISKGRGLDTTKITDSALLSSAYQDWINALGTHAANENLTDLNTMLSGLGLNVDPAFDEAYYLVKGAHLWGENVFADAVITLGTMDVTSSGVGVYTDGDALGSGTHAVTSLTNRAAGMLHAIPQATVSGNDIILDIRLTNEDDVAINRNVTVPNGTASGTPISVGTSGTDFFRSVTNIALAGGNTSDQVLIQNQAPERIVAL